MNIVPNPCAVCEIIITNTATSNNLTLTDILGRRLNKPFIKTEKGYQVYMQNEPSGIYIIRNTQTGEAVKFVKD
jgi:hypothetical protein